MVVEIDALGLAPAAVPVEDQPPLIVDADRVAGRPVCRAASRSGCWAAPASPDPSSRRRSSGACGRAGFRARRGCAPTSCPRQRRRATSRLESSRSSSRSGICTYVPLLGTFSNDGGLYRGAWRSRNAVDEGLQLDVIQQNGSDTLANPRRAPEKAIASGHPEKIGKYERVALRRGAAETIVRTLGSCAFLDRLGVVAGRDPRTKQQRPKPKEWELSKPVNPRYCA